jgi:hypothetical protein
VAAAGWVVRWAARWAVRGMAAAAVQAPVRSAVNPCLNLSNTRRSELLPSLPHRRHIALRLNNLSIRVWLLGARARAVGMAVCAGRWICALNHAAVVVGFKPISM